MTVKTYTLDDPKFLVVWLNKNRWHKCAFYTLESAQACFDSILKETPKVYLTLVLKDT